MLPKLKYHEPEIARPVTGWGCAVCFQNANVFMIDVTLCTPHAKRYNFGYGETLKSMSKEVKE